METPAQPGQPPQTIQLSALLSNYEKRKEKGLITLENRNGQVMLLIKRFDQETAEEIRPMAVPLNEHQLDKLAIEADRQKAEIRMQIANLNEGLANIDADLETIPKLKEDMQATLNGG